MENDNIKFLQADDIHLFYEMMYQALKTDDVIGGMNQSLYLLKKAFETGNIILYKKMPNGRYASYITDSSMKEVPHAITCIVNKASILVENKSCLDIKLDLAENLKDIKFIHVKTDNHDYILSITNSANKTIDEVFIDQLQKTLEIILKRAESYEHNMKAINIDLLTELDNRNSYETNIKNLDVKNDGLVYGLFDLFRLKYINDNYSHELGDIYIKETAKILHKYWPKYQIDIVNGVEKKVNTGHCVYRIGGDEFALITTNENVEFTKIKASLAAEEVRMLNIGLEIESPLGLNYGIVKHVAGDTIKNTYVNADSIMASDKDKMYTKYNIERRK